ncbi:MAG: hypothetical protein JXB19_09060 [Bacteroidales bacterium]|nr:hypothetical protein [Bacteroidales bacterium]
MEEKYLRIIIYITGFVALYTFLAIRIFPLMNAVLNEKMDQETQDFNKFGDLYYFSCISEFQEEFPSKVRKYRYSEDNPDISSADILTYGDSFFDIIFTKSIPERLSDTLNSEVYSYVTQNPTHSNPFCLLNISEYPPVSNQKYFIYETVERNIPAKFSNEFDPNCTVINETTFSKIYNQLLNIIFRTNSENLYEVILKQSYLTHRTYSYIATLKFKLFGYISPLTSKYKTGNKPWLFYDKEYDSDPGSFYYNYSDDEIDMFANNIGKLRDELLNRYNLKLVFFPIPNKYTLYHRFINNDPYNEFLPRLYKELDSRQIQYVDVYHEFKNNKDTLYYGTDTHWNSKGIDIALSLLIENMDLHYSLSLNN